MVYVRVLCGVRYVFMGLRQEEDITQPMERKHQVVIVIKIAVCKFKWSITKRSSA